MTANTYKDAYRQAMVDLIKAIKERDRWNLEIAKLQQLVASLKATVEPTSAEEAPEENVGFTDLVLGIVNRSATPLTPAQVKSTMLLFGYDVTQYSNPLAMIHQSLKRLATQGRIQDLKNGSYKRTALFEMLLQVKSKGQK